MCPGHTSVSLRLSPCTACICLHVQRDHNVPVDMEYISALYGEENVDTSYFELPFIETQLLINECAELVYEKAQQTGIIKISEKGSNRKDRYSSYSMSNYFIDQLEVDLFGKNRKNSFDPSALASLSRKPKIYKQ